MIANDELLIEVFKLGSVLIQDSAPLDGYFDSKYM